MTARFATTAIIASSLISPIAPGAQAQVDPAALVRQSVQNYGRDWREAMTWSYRQTDVSRSEGMPEVAVSEISPVDGTPYERLVLKNGQKLSPDEQRRQERNYEKTLRQREEETPEERLERIRKYEAERAFIKDIPEAYSFQLTGETVIRGRPAWIVKMTPRPGFVPTAPHASMLRHIDGTLWLDKEDVQWAKAEADVIDTIGIGWIMARIGPGTHFSVEQTRVADGLWLPQRIVISGVARVLLVHSKVLNEELTYSGFQKSGAVANAKSRGKVAIPPAGNSFR